MKWFMNLKTRTKFFVSVITVIAGLLLVILYGIRILNSSSKTFVGLIEKDQGLVLSLSEIYAQGLQSEQATRNVLLNPNDQKAKDNYQKADKDFTKLLTQAKELSADNPAILEKLNQIEVKWKKADGLKRNVQEVAISGNMAEAINILTGSETPLWRDLKDDVLKLGKNIKEDIEAKKKQTIESAGSAYRNMIIYALVIVIISMVILLIVANTFVKPIKLLEMSANKVADGDTDIKVEINSTDEMGNLAKSFNVMVGNIKNLLAEAKRKGEIAENAAREAEKAKTLVNEQKHYLDINIKKLLD
ncbi:MAG: HAMP domain-containing protein, partial [Bacillota bacterium]